MDTSSTLARTEAELRSQLEDWAHAVRARDIDRIFAHNALDIVGFDAIAQLQFKGADADRKHWQTCLTVCSGPMIFELHELQITAGDDLAFARGRPALQVLTEASHGILDRHRHGQGAAVQGLLYPPVRLRGAA